MTYTEGSRQALHLFACDEDKCDDVAHTLTTVRVDDIRAARAERDADLDRLFPPDEDDVEERYAWPSDDFTDEGGFCTCGVCGGYGGIHSGGVNDVPGASRPLGGDDDSRSRTEAWEPESFYNDPALD